MANYSKWLSLGLEKGLSDLQFFISTNDSSKVVVYQGKVEQNTVSKVTGMTVKGVFNGKLSTVYSEHISDTTIDSVLNQLIANAKAITINEPAIIYGGSPSYPQVKEHLFDFSAIAPERKVSDLLTIEKQLLAQPKVKTVQTTVYQENISKTVIVNSKGLQLQRENHLAYTYSIAVFEEGSDTITAMDMQVLHDYSQFKPAELVASIVEKGLRKLGGSSIATKEYPVVFSNERFGDILGAFDSLISAEAAHRNLTPWKGKVGQAVANHHFTLIDDPLSEEAYFQNAFDDEGVACYRKEVIKEGVFTGFLNDLKMASIYKQVPTGNSFSGHIQPTNLYVQPGTKTLDELIAPIEDGVYITDLVGIHAGVKTVSGDFSLQASGLRIENGRLTTAVKMIVVSGNFFTMLMSLEGFANDLKFDVSGIGSASAYVGKLSISGQQ